MFNQNLPEEFHPESKHLVCGGGGAMSFMTFPALPINPLQALLHRKAVAIFAEYEGEERVYAYDMVEYVSEDKAYLQFRVVKDLLTEKNVEILVTPNSQTIFFNGIEKTP